jgi:hypothetical protein
VTIDKEGVLLKKKSMRAKQPTGSQISGSPWGKPELLQFHFKQLPLCGQKSRLDGLPGVNRLHRSTVRQHLRAQLRQLLRRSI